MRTFAASSFLRTALIVAAVGAVPLAAGCASMFGSTDDSSAKALFQEPKYEDQNGVTITTQNIKMDDDRLVFDLTFWNKTDQPMQVDRDKLALRLPDGSRRARYKGMMTGFGMSPPTHDIPAHGSHEVQVQFVVGPPPESAILEWNGVLANGQELALPPFTVTRKGPAPR